MAAESEDVAAVEEVVAKYMRHMLISTKVWQASSDTKTFILVTLIKLWLSFVTFYCFAITLSVPNFYLKQRQWTTKPPTFFPPYECTITVGLFATFNQRLCSKLFLKFRFKIKKISFKCVLNFLYVSFEFWK